MKRNGEGDILALLPFILIAIALIAIGIDCGKHKPGRIFSKNSKVKATVLNYKGEEQKSKTITIDSSNHALIRVKKTDGKWKIEKLD